MVACLIFTKSAVAALFVCSQSFNTCIYNIPPIRCNRRFFIKKRIFKAIEYHHHVMRKFLLIASFILPYSSFAKQNPHCNWSAGKAGITLRYSASCDKENQSSLNNVLNKSLTLLNRHDTSLKILVIINQRQLSFSGDKSSNFVSIGYDTLRPIDNGYILQYYTTQETISTKQNHGFNTFDTRKSPLDINATSNNSSNDIGIKIIYDKDEPVWSEIINAIVYAAKNADLIKVLQRRDTVFYEMNGWHVSLVTLNAAHINKILGTVGEVVQTSNKKTSESNYFIFGGVAVLIIVALIVTRKTKVK